MLRRNGIKQIATLKEKKTPIVCLTSYTYPQSKILDKHCDLLLVGDSLGMVLYGYESTLTVSVDLMIQHGKAVVKGTEKALVVVDMPFGSYQKNKEQAFENCSKVLAETGCQAVKLEGGIEIAETIKHLVDLGIPVMGHIGMKPQHHNAYGGFNVQGKDDASRDKVLEDAIAVEKAGVFSFVLEAVTEDVANEVCEASKVPVIGIGATSKADGQILVCEDLLGMFEKSPKFVKNYTNLSEKIDSAVESYAKEVKNRIFPGENNIYKKTA